MALIPVHIPSHEHARAIAFVLSGCFVGAVISNLVSSPLVASQYGWPSVFYLFGFIGILWLIPWFMFDAPALLPCSSLESIETELLESGVELDSFVNDDGSIEKGSSESKDTLNDDGTEHEELTKVRLPGHNNL